MKINNLDPLEPTISSAKYIGLNSEFVDGEANYDQIAPQTYADEVKNGLESALKLTTNRNKLNFDLTTQGNFLDNLRETAKEVNTKMKKAPNQFKALIASRSDGVKNNILAADSDILKAPESKVATEMTFQASQEIEMFVGYKRDKNGRQLINSPMWAPLNMDMILDSSTVICKMKYTNKPEFGLKPDKDFMLPVQNSIFLISNEEITRDKTEIKKEIIQIDMVKKNGLSTYVAYATSNVVHQNESVGTLGSRRGTPTTATQRPTTGGSSGMAPRAPSGGGGY